MSRTYAMSPGATAHRLRRAFHIRHPNTPTNRHITSPPRCWDLATLRLSARPGNVGPVEASETFAGGIDESTRRHALPRGARQAPALRTRSPGMPHHAAGVVQRTARARRRI